MNKKVLGYLLIALGALDYLIWILNGLSFGWLELIVGVNIISQLGAALLITIGIILIKNAKAESISEVDSIESVKPIKSLEINKTINLINTKFGISFKMKDGSIKNIRTFKSELISAYINKQLQVNE
jgi:hypothetical protein